MLFFKKKEEEEVPCSFVVSPLDKRKDRILFLCTTCNAGHKMVYSIKELVEAISEHDIDRKEFYPYVKNRFEHILRTKWGKQSKEVQRRWIKFMKETELCLDTRDAHIHNLEKQLEECNVQPADVIYKQRLKEDI